MHFEVSTGGMQGCLNSKLLTWWKNTGFPKRPGFGIFGGRRAGHLTGENGGSHWALQQLYQIVLSSPKMEKRQ